jgi:hypothetical protein
VCLPIYSHVRLNKFLAEIQKFKDGFAYATLV